MEATGPPYTNTGTALLPTPPRKVPLLVAAVGRRVTELAATEVKATDHDGTVLVAVVDQATYRGETAVFARRGHIPTSINIPIDRIRDPQTGSLRPTAELRTLFATAGLLDAETAPITYCGGGVAATALAHALAVVGRDDVAVYDGSLAAWAADPALPLVLGDHTR